jgi:hypothetical protein
MLRSRQIAGPLFSLAAGVLAVTVAGAAAPAMAAAAPAGPVSTTPAPGTPHLSPSPSGRTEQVRQLVQCGKMMYAVGRFSRIKDGGTVYHRRNAFSFLATAPFTISNWEPGVVGHVNSIAFKSGDCSSAYLGGSFRRVHGKSARNIVKVNTRTGARRRSFAHDANNAVETLVVHGSHVLAGGFFTSINGSGRNYYASLNSKTGRDDRYLRLSISGHYDFPGVDGNRTRIYNQQLNPGGQRLLVEGDFTSVRGKSRQQIFMLSLRGKHRATVTKWRSSEFKQSCADTQPFYIHAASWSPDGSTVYTADTGFAPVGLSNNAARTGLCDAAASFPAKDTAVTANWINYTGCDSLYSTAADANTAYFAGHERWANNNQGCDAAGPGAVPAQGMVGLSPNDDPTNPSDVIWNPGRSDGIGADDMLITHQGLWIASDNRVNKAGMAADKCATMPGFAGICFMPYN